MDDIIKFGHEDFKDFRFMSNFFPSEIKVDGVMWPTVEHFYQAMKTIDLSDQEKIRKAETPGKSKRLGRRMKIRHDWEEIKEDVMLRALHFKFEAGSNFAKMLLLTEDSILAEWAPWDEYWGLGKNGNGRNRLGVLLMHVREELKNDN